MAVPAAAEEAADDAELQVVPDVPVDFELGTDSAENSIRCRSMSKTALLLEAASAQHLAAHFPYNPWCNICWLALFEATEIRQER